MRDELELTLFGSPEVRLHRLPVTGFRSSKAQALLYFLAVTARPHTRSTLAGLLWGDQPDPAARASLSKCLSNLHDLLGDAMLIERQAVAFNRNSSYQLDTERFAAGVDAPLTPETLQPLHAALALYRGDFLEGFYVRDAPDFEQWLLVQRAQYREAVVQGVHALAALADRQADLPQAIVHTRRLLALEPWREEAHRQLMVLLARSGQRSAALAQFETCRRMLEAELAVEPDAETVVVMERIKRNELMDKERRRAGDKEISITPISLSPPHLIINNLPIPPTPLIGRERELAEVRALVRSNRLVVLTGPGGVGKTRLALASAAELGDAFPDGVYFVNLAPISDPTLVIAAIAQTLGVKESGSRPLLERLINELRAQAVLLLLDNVEQVLDAVPQLAELLAGCPKLKLLVTSREVLHLYGEHEFGVPPLSLPDRAQLLPLSRLKQYEAVRLFIERGRAAKADFAVTNESAPMVVEICYRLDGLPLAIELAAARVKLFAPEALLGRLSAPLALLTGGPRDRPTRQQTIRNTIDWSYHLLSENEQALFRRLSVFVGGCTLESAAAVCNADVDLPFDAMTGVAALMDKSLLRSEEGLVGEPRFVMLETVREYALDRLVQCGEADAIRQQHAMHFLELAEQAEPWMRFMRPERDRWLERLEAEHDNVRAALEWFGEHEESERSVRLAGALLVFWVLRFQEEGRTWLEAALAKSGAVSVAARAKALVAAAHLIHFFGEYAMALAYAEEGLALFRMLDDKGAIAHALYSFAGILWHMGEYVAARACTEECLALIDEVGDQWGRANARKLLELILTVQGDLTQAAVYNDEFLTFYRQIGYKKGMAQGLTDKGVLAQLQDDWAHAVVFYAESLVFLREVGPKDMTALVLHNLGGAMLHQGDERGAAVCFTDGLALSRELGYRYGIAMNLAGMAGVAAVDRHPERSARLFGAAEAVFDAMGQVVEPVDRAEYDRNREIAHAQLDAATFAAAWSEGQAMTLDDAVAYALISTESTTAG
jgi:predicted ATPase/DNA-binding SARP family transcriptional activator